MSEEIQESQWAQCSLRVAIEGADAGTFNVGDTTRRCPIELAGSFVCDQAITRQSPELGGPANMKGIELQDFVGCYGYHAALETLAEEITATEAAGGYAY